MKRFFQHAAITFSIATFIFTLSIVTQGSSSAAMAEENPTPQMIHNYSIDKSSVIRNSWTKVGESDYAPRNIRTKGDFLIIDTSGNN